MLPFNDSHGAGERKGDGSKRCCPRTWVGALSLRRPREPCSRSRSLVFCTRLKFSIKMCHVYWISLKYGDLPLFCSNSGCPVPENLACCPLEHLCCTPTLPQALVHGTVWLGEAERGRVKLGGSCLVLLVGTCSDHLGTAPVSPNPWHLP